MQTLDVLLKKQALLNAMRLLSNGIICQSEYEEIQQSYMDVYLLYVSY